MAGQLGRQRLPCLYSKVHLFVLVQGSGRIQSKFPLFHNHACQFSHDKMNPFRNQSLCKLLNSTGICLTEPLQRLGPAMQCHGMATACVAYSERHWIGSTKLSPEHHQRRFSSVIAICGCYCDAHWSLRARHCTKLYLQCRYSSKMRRSETRYRAIDRVPKDLELLYRAPMDTYLTISQTISSVCLLTLFCMMAFKIGLDAPFLQFPVALELGTAIGNSLEFYGSLAGFAVATLSIYSLASRYPVRIYGNQETGNYVSVFLSPVPLQTRQVIFEAGDVTQDDRGMWGLVPWTNAQFRIGQRKVILLPEFFRKPSDLNTMMKPVNPPSEGQSET